MNKKILKIAICMAVLAIFGFVVLSMQQKSETMSSQSKNIEQLSSTTAGVKSVAVSINPFDFQQFFSEEDSDIKNQKYTDSQTGNIISFSPAEPFRNPTYAILLNGNKIGEFSGQGISNGVFSENGQYLAFKSRLTLGCAGTCQVHILFIVDLKNESVKQIFLPKISDDLEEALAGYHDFSTYVDSFEWKNNELVITMAAIGLMSEGPKQIGPMETYQYNPETETLSKVLK